jgi:hypothetical protein
MVSLPLPPSSVSAAAPPAMESLPPRPSILTDWRASLAFTVSAIAVPDSSRPPIFLPSAS